MMSRTLPSPNEEESTTAPFLTLGLNGLRPLVGERCLDHFDPTTVGPRVGADGSNPPKNYRGDIWHLARVRAKMRTGVIMTIILHKRLI